MKNYLIVLGFIAMIGAALFYDQVWAIFARMSVLEMLNTIVTFILHVAVATIAAYAVMLIPEYVKPWLKLYRKKHKDIRRGRVQVAAHSRSARQPKLTVEQWMALQKAPSLSSPRAAYPPKSRSGGDLGEVETVELKF